MALDKASTALVVGLKKDLVDKIKTKAFTATSNLTKTIIHGLSYDTIHDDLLLFYKGILLDSTNYTETNTTITLTDWSISTGEIIKFKLYKNVK